MELIHYGPLSHPTKQQSTSIYLNPTLYILLRPTSPYRNKTLDHNLSLNFKASLLLATWTEPLVRLAVPVQDRLPLC
jgi:hypothetical protein